MIFGIFRRNSLFGQIEFGDRGLIVGVQLVLESGFLIGRRRSKLLANVGRIGHRRQTRVKVNLHLLEQVRLFALLFLRFGIGGRLGRNLFSNR